MTLGDNNGALMPYLTLVGSATSFRALGMARTEAAKAVFVLTNKLTNETSDPLLEDAETIMRTLAIKKYAAHVPVFVESQLPTHHAQFHYLSDQLLCVPELTLGILSQSSRVPGFATLISLLSTSMTETTRKELEWQANNENKEYLNPYIQGTSQEIYSCKFPPIWIGMTFHHVAKVLYKKFAVCLIGLGASVDRAELPEGLRFHIVLNPASHVLTGKEIGFVIGAESDVVAEIMNYSNPNVGLGGSVETLVDNEADDVDESTGLLHQQSASTIIELQHEAIEEEEDNDDINVPLFNSKGGENVAESSKSASEEPSRKTATLLPSANPVALDDDIATSSNPQEDLNLKIRNHIILCDSSPMGTLPKELDLFFQPLRHKLISSITPVVILSPVDPPSSIQGKFSQVYYVRGNPLHRNDLIRAGIARASKLVILCSLKAAKRTADAGAILTTLNAESVASEGDCFPVIEFVHKENFKFIAETEILRSVKDVHGTFQYEISVWANLSMNSKLHNLFISTITLTRNWDGF
jgi:hypothetical protein